MLKFLTVLGFTFVSIQSALAGVANWRHLMICEQGRVVIDIEQSGKFIRNPSRTIKNSIPKTRG